MGLIKAIHIIIQVWMRPVLAAKGNEVPTRAYAKSGSLEKVGKEVGEG